MGTKQYAQFPFSRSPQQTVFTNYRPRWWRTNAWNQMVLRCLIGTCVVSLWCVAESVCCIVCGRLRIAGPALRPCNPKGVTILVITFFLRSPFFYRVTLESHRGVELSQWDMTDDDDDDGGCTRWAVQDESNLNLCKTSTVYYNYGGTMEGSLWGH